MANHALPSPPNLRGDFRGDPPPNRLLFPPIPQWLPPARGRPPAPELGLRPPSFRDVLGMSVVHVVVLVFGVGVP